MPKIAFALLVLGFNIIWSSAFIAGRVAIDSFDPLTTLVLRFMISSLLLLPFCLLKGARLLDKKLIFYGMLLGFMNNAVYLGLTFSSLLFISPGWVVIIVSCSPFITTALAVAFRLEKLSIAKLLGICIGISGVLVLTGLSGLNLESLLGIGMALGGTVAFSLGTIVFRGKADQLPIHPMNFWLSVSGALFLLPLSLAFGSIAPVIKLSSVLAILHLCFISIAAMALWFMLIRLRGAGTASSYHLMNPIIGVLLSWLVVGTELRAQDFAGAIIIGLGLFISIYGSAIYARLKAKPAGPAVRGGPAEADGPAEAASPATQAEAAGRGCKPRGS